MCPKFIISMIPFCNVIFLGLIYYYNIRFPPRIKKLKFLGFRNVSMNILVHEGEKLLDGNGLVGTIQGVKTCEEE